MFCVYSDSLPVHGGGFGEGSGVTILLDDLMCTGQENSLLDCLGADNVGTSDCDHSEDAGVRCEGEDIKLQLHTIKVSM